MVALPESFYMSLQLLATSLVYVGTLRRRPRFVLRSCCLIVLFLFASLVDYGFSDKMGLMVVPLAIYLLFGFLLCLLFNEEGRKLAFVFLATVVTQHVAVALSDAFRAMLAIASRSWLWNGICILSFAATLGMCYRYFGKQTRYITRVKMQSFRLIILALIIFGLVYWLRVASILEMMSLETDSPMWIMVNLYDATGGVAALLMLFAGNHEDVLAEENRMMEQMFREKQSQESMMKETMDLVNIKYHDMKQMIEAMRNHADEKTLESLEKELPEYEAILQTGNSAMDTVLMNKMSYCLAKGIALECMVDGEKLSMLSNTDIYALFGNLLDNAVEAALREAKDKRLITLQVFKKRGYLCVHVENYCSHPPRLENGMPKTSKQDPQYHGFGMKSIAYITEKHHGHMAITSENKRFCVDLLFPLA